MEPWEDSYYSDSLARAVGYVVLEAAQSEDRIGELVQLRAGSGDPHTQWWASGQVLIEAVKSIGDPELDPLVAGMGHLYPLRNEVVHSIWLMGHKGFSAFRMMRTKSTRKDPQTPSYSVGDFQPHEDGDPLRYLEELARSFRRLDRMASEALSDAMGLQRDPHGSLLPPRIKPVVLPERTHRD